MSNSIIDLDKLVSTTSIEIAELTGKRHDNVVRDIRNMVQEINGLKTEGVGEETYKDAKGENRIRYRLDRKHTFVLITGYSAVLRAKCYDHIQILEQKILMQEDQLKRVAMQSANRRGVTWGDYCNTVGLPAQKLMEILKAEKKLFHVNSKNGEWSVNPKFNKYFRVIIPKDGKFSRNGINIRFNAEGLEFFSRPENILKFREKVVSRYGSDRDKQRFMQEKIRLSKSTQCAVARGIVSDQL